MLAAGMHIAAITDRPEGTLFGYPVIDGDEHDLRFLDPTPCVVGLKPKGSLVKAQKKDLIYETTDSPGALAA